MSLSALCRDAAAADDDADEGVLAEAARESYSERV